MKKSNVLVIDDDPSMLELARFHLIDSGYLVETASTGREGIEKVSGDTFDLVLTDQVMPDVSGIDLAARIHAVRPDLPVVLCTGGNQHDEHRARRAGIRAILLKPITSRDLAALLDRLLLPAA